MERRLVLLIGSETNPGSAKTAVNLIRYKRDEVVAIWSPAHAGKNSQALFAVGKDVPVVANLKDAPDANTLLVGIAPAGGKLPPDLRAVIMEGIRRGMNVVSGLHQFLSDDAEISAAAVENKVRLEDIRKNSERDVAQRTPLRPDCLRIHTVGHDCNVGKMVTSLELTLGLQKQGRDAKFIATGQTGIMIEGDGCPVDAVVVDFINGAAEKLVTAHQHREILVIEGQGSISHPRYSAVTLGLLHGCVPHGLILCYEMGRETVYGLPTHQIPPLAQLKEIYEQMANLMNPCRTIGVAINGRRFPDDEVDQEVLRIEKEFGIPACDVLRHGPDKLVKAILDLQLALGKSSTATPA